MTTTPTYPGVYVTEVPSGNRTLTGVATSITAFIGGAARGRLHEPVSINNFSDFQRNFGGLDRKYGLGYAVRDFYLNGGGPALVVRVAPADAHAAKLKVGRLTLTATGPGEWGNGLEVRVTSPSSTESETIAESQGLPKNTEIFNLEIKDGPAGDAPAEVFRNLTMVDGPRRVDRVLAASLLVTVTGTSTGDKPKDTPTPIKATGKDGRGTDGGEFKAAAYLGEETDKFEDNKKGLYALNKADLVNLIVIPPPTHAGELDKTVWQAALTWADKHRAFLIVDPASTLTAASAQGFAADLGLGGTATRNAALFYPRVRRADPLNGGAVDTFAPGGAVAGVFARTDGARGVWKAPAGLEAGLNGVVALDVDLTNDEQGPLNQAGVNVLRTFRGIGTVIWGARTLRGADVLADDYKYIPVRRLALFLEESLYRGTQWVVFEPNDEPLWSQIRLSVGAFMHDLFVKGAFQGSLPQDAYFVRCDSETTTQYDIDSGIVNIKVGFAPLKPAEFVMISIQQMTASATA